MNNFPTKGCQGLSNILHKSFLYLPTFIERSNLNPTIKNTGVFNTFYKQYLKSATDCHNPEGIKFVIQLHIKASFTSVEESRELVARMSTQVVRVVSNQQMVPNFIKQI